MRPGPLLRAIAAQAQMELVLTVRRGESILVTVIIPAALLAFFASSRVLPAAGRSVSFLLPGTLSLAIISASFVSLGIATAYERYYGVLRRLGATPFPRSGLILSKMLGVLSIETIQLVLLIGMSATFFGWRPHGSVLLGVLALLLGTSAFAGLGLLMAGLLRAEATLAVANGAFMLFVLAGGLYVPLDHLPAWLASVADLLPAAALAEVLRAALASGSHLPVSSTVVLLFWALAAPLGAVLTFRWE